MSSYRSLTDQELVRSLEAGEEVSFIEIYNCYWKLLFHTAYHINHDEAYAQM